jgi:beta-lactamase class A
MSTELPRRLQTHLEQLDGQAGFAAECLKTGRRLSYGNRVFLSASTIKLPILAVYCAAAERDWIPNVPYYYQPEDWVEDSPFFDKLPAGTPVSWYEVARQMIIISDNTATNLLIKMFGLPRLQGWIRKNGLKQTRIERRMMDLAARARGIDNWTTPEDMLLLIKKLVQHRLSEPGPEGCEQMLAILHQQQDREKIPFLFSAPVKVANKPGELPGTRSDVGYIHDGQSEIVLSVFADQLENESASDLWLAQLAQLLWYELTNS